jgi:hypothetical protein
MSIDKPDGNPALKGRNTISPDAFLKIIADLNLHLDRVIWSQIQTLIALEGAVLGAGYATRGSSVSIFVVVTGFIFLSLLYLFVERLRDNRDVNMPLADKLIELYADSELKNLIGVEDIGRRLRFARHLPNGKWMIWSPDHVPLVTGTWLFRLAFGSFLVLDLVALGYLLCQLH